MRNTLIAIAATLGLASAVQAAEVTADLGLDFTQNASDKVVATTSVDVALTGTMGFGTVGLAVENNTLTLDTYSIGTSIGDVVVVSFGDQGDLLGGFEGKTEAVGGTTLTNLDDDGESLMANAYGFNVMIGLTDISKDVTDVKNVQGAYAFATNGIQVLGGFDYNLDSEEITLLSSAGYAMNGFGLGLTTTYQVDAEALGFEADVTAYGVTAFLNGDKDDMLQNVGAGYYGKLNGMGVYAEAAYNIDTEEFTPAAGISFNF